MIGRSDMALPLRKGGLSANCYYYSFVVIVVVVPVVIREQIVEASPLFSENAHHRSTIIHLAVSVIVVAVVIHEQVVRSIALPFVVSREHGAIRNAEQCTP